MPFGGGRTITESDDILKENDAVIVIEDSRYFIPINYLR